MAPLALLSLILLSGVQSSTPSVLDRLSTLDGPTAARLVASDPAAVRHALDELLARVDASVHSDRRRPEQRRVQYDREALALGIRTGRLFAETTGDTTYARRFAAREQRLDGTELLNQRRYREALQPLNAALAEARALDDRWLETITRVNLAYGHLELGQGAEALKQCEAAAAASRTLDDKAQGLTLLNLGSMHLHLGDAVQSLEYSTRAIAMSQKAGIRLWEGNSLLNVGAAHFQLGDLDASRDAFARALAVIGTTKDRLGQGRALYNLGLIAARQQRFAEAAAHMERALPIIREVDIRHSHEIETNPEQYQNPVERSALQVLVEAYSRLGEDEKAAIHEAALRKLKEAAAGGAHSHRRPG